MSATVSCPDCNGRVNMRDNTCACDRIDAAEQAELERASSIDDFHFEAGECARIGCTLPPVSAMVVDSEGGEVVQIPLCVVEALTVNLLGEYVDMDMVTGFLLNMSSSGHVIDAAVSLLGLDETELRDVMA